MNEHASKTVDLVFGLVEKKNDALDETAGLRARVAELETALEDAQHYFHHFQPARCERCNRAGRVVRAALENR